MATTLAPGEVKVAEPTALGSTPEKAELKTSQPKSTPKNFMKLTQFFQKQSGGKPARATPQVVKSLSTQLFENADVAATPSGAQPSTSTEESAAAPPPGKEEKQAEEGSHQQTQPASGTPKEATTEAEVKEVLEAQPKSEGAAPKSAPNDSTDEDMDGTNALLPAAEDAEGSEEQASAVSSPGPTTGDSDAAGENDASVQDEAMEEGDGDAEADNTFSEPLLKALVSMIHGKKLALPIAAKCFKHEHEAEKLTAKEIKAEIKRISSKSGPRAPWMVKEEVFEALGMPIPVIDAEDSPDKPKPSKQKPSPSPKTPKSSKASKTSKKASKASKAEVLQAKSSESQDSREEAKPRKRQRVVAKAGAAAASEAEKTATTQSAKGEGKEEEAVAPGPPPAPAVDPAYLAEANALQPDIDKLISESQSLTPNAAHEGLEGLGTELCDEEVMEMSSSLEELKNDCSSSLSEFPRTQAAVLVRLVQGSPLSLTELSTRLQRLLDPQQSNGAALFRTAVPLLLQRTNYGSHVSPPADLGVEPWEWDSDAEGAVWVWEAVTKELLLKRQKLESQQRRKMQKLIADNARALEKLAKALKTGKENKIADTRRKLVKAAQNLEKERQKLLIKQEKERAKEEERLAKEMAKQEKKEQLERERKEKELEKQKQKEAETEAKSKTKAAQATTLMSFFAGGKAKAEQVEAEEAAVKSAEVKEEDKVETYVGRLVGGPGSMRGEVLPAANSSENPVQAFLNGLPAPTKLLTVAAAGFEDPRTIPQESSKPLSEVAQGIATAHRTPCSRMDPLLRRAAAVMLRRRGWRPWKAVASALHLSSATEEEGTIDPETPQGHGIGNRIDVTRKAYAGKLRRVPFGYSHLVPIQDQDVDDAELYDLVGQFDFDVRDGVPAANEFQMKPQGTGAGAGAGAGVGASGVNAEGKKTTLKEFKRWKFFQFHEDVRPAWWGTYSKLPGRDKSGRFRCGPRNPFGKDWNLMDYDVDSEAEWEEEEPGESLSDADGEEDMEEEEEKPTAAVGSAEGYNYGDTWLCPDDEVEYDGDAGGSEADDDDDDDEDRGLPDGGGKRRKIPARLSDAHGSLFGADTEDGLARCAKGEPLPAIVIGPAFHVARDGSFAPNAAATTREMLSETHRSIITRFPVAHHGQLNAFFGGGKPTPTPLDDLHPLVTAAAIGAGLLPENPLEALQAAQGETRDAAAGASTGEGQSPSAGGSSDATPSVRSKAVPEEAMSWLIETVHGSSQGLKKLVTAVVDEYPEVSKRQAELKIREISVKTASEEGKRVWKVHDHVFQHMDMTAPPPVTPSTAAQSVANTSTPTAPASPRATAAIATAKPSSPKAAQPSIMQFTKQAPRSPITSIQRPLPSTPPSTTAAASTSGPSGINILVPRKKSKKTTAPAPASTPASATSAAIDLTSSSPSSNATNTPPSTTSSTEPSHAPTPAASMSVQESRGLEESKVGEKRKVEALKEASKPVKRVSSVVDAAWQAVEDTLTEATAVPKDAELPSVESACSLITTQLAEYFRGGKDRGVLILAAPHGVERLHETLSHALTFPVTNITLSAVSSLIRALSEVASVCNSHVKTGQTAAAPADAPAFARLYQAIASDILQCFCHSMERLEKGSMSSASLAAAYTDVAKNALRVVIGIPARHVVDANGTVVSGLKVLKDFWKAALPHLQWGLACTIQPLLVHSLGLLDRLLQIIPKTVCKALEASLPSLTEQWMALATHPSASKGARKFSIKVVLRVLHRVGTSRPAALSPHKPAIATFLSHPAIAAAAKTFDSSVPSLDSVREVLSKMRD